MFEIPTKDAEKTIRLLKEHKEVLEVPIIQQNARLTHIIIKQKKHLATAPYLAKANVAWISPTWTEPGGLDRVTMIAPSFENLKKFMDLVSEKGYDLKIKSKRYLDAKSNVSLEAFRSSGFTKLQTASELLTDRQMEVFDLACKYGYYEEPKKVSIRELAEKLGVSESTCAELLRKSERKLMPILNEILRIIR
ncbi:helix-turn-helix domain-containing protein [Candidatus Micrarchaeota archaeon]|nr:helix-turn-helix domain-containing protein [Candidatus Micrarchaeota archaeon]